MSTTALMPLDPAASPQHAARVLSIRANLLPPEISDGRRARRTRTAVVVMVVLVLILLGGWYWTAAAENQDAEKEFEDVTRQVSAVQKQQNQYVPLTKVKNSNTVMSGQLAKLMAKDLSWQSLLDLVRTTGEKSGAKVTQLSGALTEDKSAPRLACNDDEIGKVSVSGSAKDKKAVAKYIEALLMLRSKGLADPFVSTVTGNDTVNFELTVSITPKALGGQFATSPCKSGGK